MFFLIYDIMFWYLFKTIQKKYVAEQFSGKRWVINNKHIFSLFKLKYYITVFVLRNQDQNFGGKLTNSEGGGLLIWCAKF